MTAVLCAPGRGTAHRTRYSEPDGPVARGVCRYCGYESVALNGDPGDYEAPPTGYGLSGNRKYGQERWRGYSTVKCPTCDLAVDGPRMEQHMREKHEGAA